MGQSSLLGLRVVNVHYAIEPAPLSGQDDEKGFLPPNDLCIVRAS